MVVITGKTTEKIAKNRQLYKLLREENIRLLSKICDTLIEEKNQYCKILLRNMTKLNKKYPDLITLGEKLKVI